MAGRRRTQRGVRVTVSVALVVAAAVCVAASVPFGRLWADASSAVAAAVLGAIAVRIMYAEVIATRRESAHARAAQARDFADALSRKQRDHDEYTRAIGARLQRHERDIAELTDAVGLADRRARQAQSRAAQEARLAAEARLLAAREAQRADDTAARLDELLDQLLPRPVAYPGERNTGNEVIGDLSPASADASTIVSDSAGEGPTVVELVAWESRTNVARLDDLRRHA